jgi:hypothetical protein
VILRPTKTAVRVATAPAPLLLLNPFNLVFHSTESEEQARHELYDQQVVQPVLAAGAEEEDVCLWQQGKIRQFQPANARGQHQWRRAGGGSACISRSGGKQRQVVREVMSGPHTHLRKTTASLWVVVSTTRRFAKATQTASAALAIEPPG